ncbi:uncharacterized protein LOC108115038 [Drosophila eugracilis]|uniref:uncharacterized protein LOC108115038 n=1 Tax=Drosophila eugracilis TaxID=29029 RepID=UPI001BD98EA3|nr:uncharacterized protein LOC108115038 [Drosophila eugracilis]
MAKHSTAVDNEELELVFGEDIDEHGNAVGDRVEGEEGDTVGGGNEVDKKSDFGEDKDEHGNKDIDQGGAAGKVEDADGKGPKDKDDEGKNGDEKESEKKNKKYEIADARATMQLMHAEIIRIRQELMIMQRRMQLMRLQRRMRILEVGQRLHRFLMSIRVECKRFWGM